MLRFSVGLLGLCVLFPALGCSDDDDSGAGDATTGTGSNSPAPTYSAAETCDKFARTTCSQAATCGLGAQVLNQLFCVQCSEATIETLASACVDNLSGPQNAADVDRCLASIEATSCTDACNDADVPDCEVLGELTETDRGPLVCDARCISG